ncbi:Oxidoreductase, short-chain dehydrogenase/reductase family [invertebrate metagenome]|uniref:Oxidoreductase, short-chain dehydrogenase/reductase family n=1 Tax=invertebrate metagenome TaxID=1711999 RepID=A0A484H5A4_9ZZZZ
MSLRTGHLEGRVALVTGASRGIGRAVARRFAAEGATVVAVARTKSALEELDDEIRVTSSHNQAVLVPQDLADHARIDQMALAVYQRFGRLDVLVGNAAMLGPLGPMQHITPQDWAHIIGVNVTANFHLLRSFDPLLRQSDAGRAIFVTSGVTTGIFPYWGAYAISKAALEMMVKIYANEVSQTRLRVNLLDPGTVRTRMRAHAFPGEDPNRLPLPESVTDSFVALASPECCIHGKIVHVSHMHA